MISMSKQASKQMFTDRRLDMHLRRILRDMPNLAIPWFLMCGYTYEVLSHTLIADQTWDWLCKYIDDNWDELEHPNKNLIKRDWLSTGTAAYLGENYLPVRVKDTAKMLLTHGLETEAEMTKRLKKELKKKVY